MIVCISAPLKHTNIGQPLISLHFRWLILAPLSTPDTIVALFFHTSQRLTVLNACSLGQIPILISCLDCMKLIICHLEYWPQGDGDLNDSQGHIVMKLALLPISYDEIRFVVFTPIGKTYNSYLCYLMTANGKKR